MSEKIPDKFVRLEVQKVVDKRCKICRLLAELKFRDTQKYEKIVEILTHAATGYYSLRYAAAELSRVTNMKISHMSIERHLNHTRAWPKVRVRPVFRYTRAYQKEQEHLEEMCKYMDKIFALEQRVRELELRVELLVQLCSDLLIAFYGPEDLEQIEKEWLSHLPEDLREELRRRFVEYWKHIDEELASS